MANSVWLFPKGFSLLSYIKVLGNNYFWRSFFNSVFYVVLITLLNNLNSVLAGYALARKGLVFRKIIIVYLLIPMFFSGGLIPTFILMINLRLYNTIWAIIIPATVSVWNIILVRTYINTLPQSLSESAIIDGASDFRILFSIILPLVKPIVAVISLYTAIGVWNNWFNAMIYLPRKPEWHPLQMFLTRVLIWGEMQSTATYSPTDGLDPELMKQSIINAAVGGQLKYTLIIVSSLPIILVYPFLQKYFIKGALLGSLKE
ncbi:MAG TPA: carbohydrate ABC transporter permease [Clostridiaceae bacterium]|nr:carbohydrate ABC transporter permease [Clostridiaceae bacterium]